MESRFCNIDFLYERKIWNNETSYIKRLCLAGVDNINNNINIELDRLDFIGMSFGLLHDHPERFGAE
jgi:hypothetical protein